MKQVSYVVGLWIAQWSNDIDIWENKIHHRKPCLVRGDGPVQKVRGWFKQFVPNVKIEYSNNNENNVKNQNQEMNGINKCNDNQNNNENNEKKENDAQKINADNINSKINDNLQNIDQISLSEQEFNDW